MKKLLLTNNSAFIEDQYDEIYTDSPFVVEKFNNAKYLNELLDPDYHNKIIEIRKKGFEINRKIIEEFFPNYNNDNVSLFDINQTYTNIFINIYKLLKLIKSYPEHEITIAVSVDELYDYDSYVRARSTGVNPILVAKLVPHPTNPKKIRRVYV